MYDFFHAAVLYMCTYLRKEIANFGSHLHDLHCLGGQGTCTQPAKIHDINSLAPTEIRINRLRGPHVVLEAVHERIPKVALQLIEGDQAHDSLWVDPSHIEVVNGRSILPTTDWQEGVLTQKDAEGAPQMFFEVRPKKFDLLGFIEERLVLHTPLKDCIRIEFCSSQPPANCIGLLFDVSETIDLFGNGGWQIIEAFYELLLICCILMFVVHWSNDI